MEQIDEQPAADDPPDNPSSLHNKVFRLAKEIGRLPTGPNAQLRRGEITGEFWIMLSKIGEANSHLASLERWHTLAQCIALAGQDSTDLGAALRQAGLSDARMTRLLEAQQDALPSMFLRIARRMRSQNVSADWTRAFTLMATDTKKPRYRVARAYYLPDSDQSNAK